MKSFELLDEMIFGNGWTFSKGSVITIKEHEIFIVDVNTRNRGMNLTGIVPYSYEYFKANDHLYKEVFDQKLKDKDSLKEVVLLITKANGDFNLHKAYKEHNFQEVVSQATRVLDAARELEMYNLAPSVKEKEDINFLEKYKNHLEFKGNNGYCLNLKGGLRLEILNLMLVCFSAALEEGMTIEQILILLTSKYPDTKEGSKKFRTDIGLDY